jgi:hypothetical protein
MDGTEKTEFLFRNFSIRSLRNHETRTRGEATQNLGYEAVFNKLQDDPTERSGLQEGVYQSVERLENQPS